MHNETLLLVQAAQRGDRNVLELLFKKYLPVVRQVVALRFQKPVRSLHDHEDLVQEALLHLLQSLDRFDSCSSEGTFRGWLCSAVENRVRNVLRDEKAKKRGEGKVRQFNDLPSNLLSSSFFRGKGPSPSEVAGQKELEEKIERALLNLDDKYREVLIARDLLEMSYADVAQLLHITADNARQAVRRGREKLRALLEA